MYHRIYRISGRKVDIDTVLDYLRHLLENDGVSKQFEMLGIDFEDVLEEE